MDAGRFSAMSTDGENLLKRNRHSFLRGTALGALKRLLAVLRKCCAKIVIDARFVDMAFVRCEQ